MPNYSSSIVHTVGRSQVNIALIVKKNQNNTIIPLFSPPFVMSVSVMTPNDIERSMFPQQYPHSHPHPQQRQNLQQNGSATDGDKNGVDPGVGEVSLSSNVFDLGSTAAGAAVPQASIDSYISSMGNLDPRPIAPPLASQNQQKVQPRGFQSIVGIEGNVHANNGNVASSAIGNLLNHTNNINASMYQQGQRSGTFLPDNTMMATMLMMNNSSMNSNINNGFLSQNLAGLNNATTGGMTNVDAKNVLKDTSLAPAAAQSPSCSSGVEVGRLQLQGVTSNGTLDSRSFPLAPSTVPSSGNVGGGHISKAATTAMSGASSKPTGSGRRTVSDIDFDETTAPAPVLPSKEGQLYFDDNDVLSGRGGGKFCFHLRLVRLLALIGQFHCFAF